MRLWINAIFPYLGTLVTVWLYMDAKRYFRFMLKVEKEKYQKNQYQTQIANQQSMNHNRQTNEGVIKRSSKKKRFGLSFHKFGEQIISIIILTIGLVLLYFYVEFSKSFVICATIISVLLATQINRWASKLGVSRAMEVLSQADIFKGNT